MNRSDATLFALLLLVICACRTKKETPRAATGELPGQAVLLDSAAAAQVIVIDTVEHFFERMGPADASLQLREPLPADADRARWLPRYKALLQRDVASFTPEEADVVRRAWTGAYNAVTALNPNLLPPNIQLIKTKGKHYGPGVFYTRQNAIVIPPDQLGEGALDELQSTLIHEIFHVWSRQHRAQRDSLYALIGFAPVGVPVERLTLPDALRNRMLLNPDGIDYAYTITLRRDGRPFEAVPLLIATPARYTSEKRDFFRYLQFQLFELKRRRGGMVLNEVLATPTGTATVNMALHPEFYAQIGDNTGYIIHPEEIIAENFRMLALGEAGSGSERGQALLRDVERLLRGF